MNNSVLFQELPASKGGLIAQAILNSPATLNGLSLSMVQALYGQLQAWAQNPQIVAVVLSGAGTKAFCAGGDLQALYQSMLATPSDKPWDNGYAREFFATEYRLDYLIHCYPKPLICWASGIVMGGGVGLMLGASHRLVTDTTRFAMPEISIGLYPDVAGTWMLSRLPNGIGNFMALTGCQLGAADCLHYGLADQCLPADFFVDLMQGLIELDWHLDGQDNYALIDILLEQLCSEPTDIGPLQRNAARIQKICARHDLEQIAAGIKSLEDDADAWLVRAANTFKAGAPGSARLAFSLLADARHKSLAAVLRTEFIASIHCCAEPDFREGIRALLIDKDKAPKWQPGSLAQANQAWVQRFYATPWPRGHEHPLADLGA